MDILLTGGKTLPVWASILNIVIVLLGLWILRKVLRIFFGDRIASLTLFLVFFGTNYLQQVTGK